MTNAFTIAITGTPGVGKSTVVEQFKKANYEVVSVLELAKQHGCVGEFDESKDSQEIEIHQLAELLEFEGSINTIIDGHLSHFLSVDAIVVLRCNPHVLRERLSQRGYKDAKVNANTEWEMLSGTWSEILEFEMEQPVMEIDTSETSPQLVFDRIVEWIANNFPMASDEINKSIDWLTGN